MRASIVLAGLLAAVAVASPVKRDIVYHVVEVQTVVEYVYAGEQTPAPASPAAVVDDAHHDDAAGNTNPVETPAPEVEAVQPVNVDTFQPQAEVVHPVEATSAVSETTVDDSEAKPEPVTKVNPTGDGLPPYNPNLQVGDAGFAEAALAHHNVHRANHSAPALVYNYTMAPFAQAKAEACVWDEEMPHGISGCGMNIAQGTYVGAANISSTISDLWYNCEYNHYTVAGGWGNKDPNVSGPGSNFAAWGHLTQVVWSGTKSVACGAAQCGPSTSISSGYFTVCMYYPPGNYLGAFDQVGMPKGKAIVHGR